MLMFIRRPFLPAGIAFGNVYRLHLSRASFAFTGFPTHLNILACICSIITVVSTIQLFLKLLKLVVVVAMARLPLSRRLLLYVFHGSLFSHTRHCWSCSATEDMMIGRYRVSLCRSWRLPVTVSFATCRPGPVVAAAVSPRCSCYRNTQHNTD